MRVRYEDLVADPLTEVQRIYRQLDLGDFEPARPAIEEYLAKHRRLSSATSTTCRKSLSRKSPAAARLTSSATATRKPPRRKAETNRR